MEAAKLQELSHVRVVSHETILENPDNPRIITEENFEKLVQSIMDFPEMLYKRALVVISVIDNGDFKGFMPLGGNMRSRAIPEAMGRLKHQTSAEARRKYDLLKEGIPIDVADHWTEEQRREFVIKDNVGFGEWDWDKLSNEWDKDQLIGWGMSIPDFKFSERNPEHAEDDFVVVVPVNAKTIKGDIYELGNHRLSCGDSTDRFNVTGLMCGQQANLVFTSPPYWVGKDYEYQNSEEQIDDFIQRICDGIALATSESFGRVVINTGTASINRIDRKRKVEILPLVDKWANHLRQHGWLLRHLRIWAKRGQLPATISPRTDVIDQHNEYIAAFEQEFSQIETFWNPEGDQRGQERLGTKWAQQGLWDDIHGERSAGGLHSYKAAFPVELAARNILLYTRRKEIIYEPFAGSGTTLIASEQLDRACYAQELDPCLCDVVVKRYVAWKNSQGESWKVIRNGKDISDEAWITEA